MGQPVLNFDPELCQRHLAEAAERLPGPEYYTVLGWLHEFLRPEVYLEIGVWAGDSLRLRPTD